MEHITTTNLRTQTPQLVEALQHGQSIQLIHRSHVVGLIRPIKQTIAKPINVEEFKKFLDRIKPKKNLSYEERDRIYREHLEKKYGKPVF